MAPSLTGRLEGADPSRQQVVRDALAQARTALRADVAYFSEFVDGQQVIRGVDGDGAAFGIVKDAAFPQEATLCRRVVDGELPSLIGDVPATPGAAELCAEVGIRACISVPVRHADGRLYGTICVADSRVRPELDDRDTRLMEVLAGVLAGQLEHDHQYHQVLESAREPVWITDLAGATAFVNQPAADLMRSTREALAARPPMEWVAPEHLDHVREVLAQRSDDGNLTRYEIDLVRPDGSRVPVEVSAAPLTDATGAVIGNLAMLTDLTERRAAERLSEARFRWLADLVEHQVWIAEPDGRLDFVNERTWEYFGFDATLGRTSDWLAFVHPEDVGAVEGIAAQVAGGEPYEFHARVRRHDGEYRLHLARAFPMHDAQGKLLRWYGITIDLTDSQAQERLRESEARLREAQRIARIGAFRITSRGELEASEEFAALFGLAPEAFAGWSSVIERIHPDDRALVPDEPPLISTRTVDSRIVLDSGEVRTLQVRRRGATGTIQDVTEQRAAEAAEAARAEAERANAAKSQFLSRMSHELRTPLNAILGFGQLLELDPLSDEQRDSVGHIMRAGAHLLELINEVLEISRIEAGALRLSLEPVEVTAAVREVAELLAPLAAERDVAVTLDALGREDFYVRADLQRIKQILLNLLSNAIKYNRVGGQVTLRVRPEAGGRVRVVVSDTGEGLLPDEVARLFSPFERLGASASSTEGTGLGLALSHALAEAMGGELTAASRVGLGTDLTLTLDVAAAPALPADAAPGAAADGDAGAGRAIRPARILYVEDNPSNLRLVERVLTRAGVEVIEAPQGRLGLDLARQHQPDLVLLDLDLPDMPGEEVLARLGADASTARIPVLVCSADANRATIDRLRDAGARDFVTKPIDVKRLLKRVGELTDAGAR